MAQAGHPAPATPTPGRQKKQNTLVRGTDGWFGEPLALELYIQGQGDGRVVNGLHSWARV